MKITKYFAVIGCILILSSCSIKNTIQDAEKAVFTVYTYDKFGAPSGTGTGFFIDDEGTAFTNYHVLDGAVKAYIETIDGHSYEIKDILMSDKNKDIVKFTINNPDNVDLPNLSLHRGNYEKGDEIIVIGSPLDLTNSVTTGIISALRTDRSHGDVIQISAPISPGNSGSPVLTKNGKVIGIATFNRVGGQNLNFAVATKNVDELSSNDFEKENRKFNLKDDFVILNLPSDNGSDIILNAIEFGKNQTTAYFTFINMNLMYGDAVTIWNELYKDENDHGFCIKDQAGDKKYYIVSSSIGANKANGADVPLCDSYQFQVYFPTIKNKLERIDIFNGDDSRSWRFTDIDLNYYRNNLSVDMNLYKKLYAMSQMKEGELGGAYQMFQEILNDNPTDVDCLNGLGLISYIANNQMDAMSYFDTAIEENPLNVLSLLESWLCLIKVWGYSDEWIYHYSNNYFFNSTNNIDNIAYLDGFFNSFQFKSKEYDAYLIVNKILRTVITNSEFNRNFVICDNIPAEIGGEKAKFQRRKTEKDIYVKWHIPKCFDIYSARESAIHAIDNLRDLFAFFHHKVKPQIQEAVLIVEKGTTIGYCVDKQTPPIAKGSDAYVNVATQKLNKLLNGIIPATDTMEKIDSVMNLHSLCVENSNPTNQLLNLWTAIEIIIPINPQKGGDKIQQIAGTLGKALTLGYCHRIFFDVFKSAKQWNNLQLISYINNVPERVGTQFERFVAFIIFPEYEEYRKQLATELSDYPLLRHRLHFLNQNYSTIKDITKILTKHEKKLGWHLRRLYRARNSIVHGSSHVFFIENLITNLHTYIDEFTSLILMLVQDKQSITTIEQGVKYINLAYDHKMSILKNAKITLTNDNYKSILFGD